MSFLGSTKLELDHRFTTNEYKVSTVELLGLKTAKFDENEKSLISIHKI